MNSQESIEFVRNYFDDLFGRRNINALDGYLDPDYFDDDIADPNVNHIKSSKEYLAELLVKRPATGVDVTDAIEKDGVVSAYLEWYVREKDVKTVIRKGVAILVLKDRKILKRHTYIYSENE